MPRVRTIGICEMVRHRISKAVLFAIKGDILEAAGPLQLCARQIAGIEAAINAVKTFQNDHKEAVLLVDASNSFNSLNRDTALQNIQHTWPSVTLLITLIVMPRSYLWMELIFSEEGTTQGDPLAMPMHVLATIPLINHLNDPENVMQA